MERAITGFHQDDTGDWVAELECGHNQHVRHRPPFQMRGWVVADETRRARVGAPLDCPLCDRGEMPVHVRHVRDSEMWDADTMPAGLRRRHRLGRGTWGVLHVDSGKLYFDDHEMSAGDTRVIPPDVEHQVEPSDGVAFRIAFYAVDRTAIENAGTDENEAVRGWPDEFEDEGGDPACWAGLLCPECGAMMDGGPHRAGCPSGG